MTQANEKYKGDALLQKTYTEDFITGRKSKNIGQRDRFYITNSHPAIVTAEVFDRVQEEMDKRARLVYKADGTVETSSSKYNGKYLLGNLLTCGHCGASYRRRTERGKVVWRCATRIEKGKEMCMDSPTVNEEWVQKVLCKIVYKENIYNEDIIKNSFEKLQTFNECLEIHCRDERKIDIRLI